MVDAEGKFRFEVHTIFTNRPRDKVGNFVGVPLSVGYGETWMLNDKLWLRAAAFGELFWLMGINSKEFKFALPLTIDVGFAESFFLQLRNYSISSSSLEVGVNREYEKTTMAPNLLVVGFFF